MTNAERHWFWSQPCVVCGCKGLTEIDHIIPKKLGGKNERSNYQPLCTQCNAKKKHRLSNAQLAEWVRSRGHLHYLMHEYLLHRRTHFAFDDQISFEEWRRLFSSGGTAK